MKNIYLICLILLLSGSSFAAEWHVMTIADGGGTLTVAQGGGTLDDPWELQFALNQPAGVLPGDIIWVHEGVNVGAYGTKAYDGRYKSWLNFYGSGSPAYITVCAWPGDHPVLNGNVSSGLTPLQKTSLASYYAMDEEEQMNYRYANRESLVADDAILEVLGPNTTFMNLELTLIGTIERRKWVSGYEAIFGLVHTSGINCKFINLVIHNASRSGVSSWKETGGTEFHGCIVYNNGNKVGTATSNGPEGVGFYVQNMTEQERIIDNNIVFNNYYKGIEIWSQSSCGNPETCENDFIKNITVSNSQVFNNTSPFYDSTQQKKDNIIVATNDASGMTVARNITIRDNFLYHTTDFTPAQMQTYTQCLAIGYRPSAPSRNIKVLDNYIFGKSYVVNAPFADSLTYKGNRLWGKYFATNDASFTSIYNNWDFANNEYYTTSSVVIQSTTATLPVYQYNLLFSTWKTTWGVDETGSIHNYFGNGYNFNPIVNKAIQNTYDPNRFTVVLFDKSAPSTMAHTFSTYGILDGTTCTVRDVENYHNPIQATLTGGQLTFDMQSTTLEYPTFVSGDTCYAVKTGGHFGIFIVDFDLCNMNVTLADPTNTVNSGILDLKQASNQIAATNTINSGGEAIYHAGNTIELKNGFTAVSGSDFRGYIAGCDDVYIARHVNPSSEESFSNANDIKPSLLTENLKVFPNPTNSTVTVEWENNISEVSLMTIDGKLILKKTNTSNSCMIDLSDYESGLYLLIVNDAKGKKIIKKIIKQ